MNHLAHLFLAGGNKPLLIGGFLGDHVKGRLNGQYPIEVELGIKLHRAIDAFTDNHAITRQSQQRFDPRFRRVSGIMTDIIYDHFLALNWHHYHPHSLNTFANQSLSILIDNSALLPDAAQKSCRAMQQYNSLPRQTEPAFIDRALTHLSGRLSRANPLAEGYMQFQLHEQALQKDFMIFFPQLIRFCEDWLVNNLEA